MKKKSQAEQVFVFMIAIILAALILLYGYKAIFGKEGLLTRTDQIALTNFESKISSSVKSISYNPGDVRLMSFDVPSKFKKVCFLQLDYAGKTSAGICNNQAEDYNPIICNAWKESGNKQNIFFVPIADIPISVSALVIANGYLCVPVASGSISLKLEGLGDKTKISQP